MPISFLGRDGLRLALLYTAIFSVIGTMMPFWPVWLAHRGMDAVEIGALLGALYWAKVVTNPAIGSLVDAYGRRKAIMIVLAVCSLVLHAAYLWVDGFWFFLLLGVTGGSLFAGLMPLSETVTMSLTVAGRLDYGRVRLWGSISFIALATTTGWLVERSSPEVVLWIVLLGVGLTVAAVLRVPDLPMAGGTGTRLPFRALLRDHRYLLFIASASLVQAGHTVYYGFATIHWRDAGLGAGLIGGLWSLGVIAEVLLFAFSNRVVGRLGATRLILIGASAGIVRWAVLGTTTDPLLLAPAQFLHALTFGATHLGAMHFIARQVEPRLTARAQATYSAMALGLVPGLALLAAGPLYQSLGGAAFFTSAAVAAMGTALAALLIRLEKGRVAARRPDQAASSSRGALPPT